MGCLAKTGKEVAVLMTDSTASIVPSAKRVACQPVWASRAGNSDATR